MLDRVQTAALRAARTSALGNWRGASGGGLTLHERPGQTMVELAAFGRGDGMREQLSRALGIALPAPGGSAETSGVAALSVGPGRWLLIAPDGAAAGVPEIEDDRAVVTDLTGGRTVLTLAGPRAAQTLMKGTAVDLDAAMFAPGAVAATALAHMPAIVWRRDGGYDVIVPRSYAASLLEWMLKAGGLDGGPEFPR
jgi:heterotetrameric sarcosine oxidase gamma subunit